MFPEAKATQFFGFSFGVKKDIQELAFLIDHRDLIVDVLLVDGINPAVIVRLIDYVKVGMPHRLDDFVSKALVIAAAHSFQHVIMDILLRDYKPNLNFKYLSKTAYTALKMQESVYGNNDLFKNMLLRVMTGGDFWEEYTKLISTDVHRAYDLVRSFISLKFDIEFNVIRDFFEYFYFNQSSSFNKEQQSFIQALLISLSPHHCIRIIQEFLKHSRDDYARAMVEDIVEGVKSGHPTTLNFWEIFTDLLPKIPQYKKGSFFDVSVNNLITLNKQEKMTLSDQEEDFDDEYRKLEIQCEAMQEGVEKNQEQVNDISRALAAPFSNDIVIDDQDLLNLISSEEAEIDKSIELVPTKKISMKKKGKKIDTQIPSLFAEWYAKIVNNQFADLHAFISGSISNPLVFSKLPYLFAYQSPETGQTLLHLLALKKVTEKLSACWDLILILGVNVNIQDNNGNTPLHVAALRANTVIFERLINESNADRTIKNRFGMTPDQLKRIAVREKNKRGTKK